MIRVGGVFGKHGERPVKPCLIELLLAFVISGPVRSRTTVDSTMNTICFSVKMYLMFDFIFWDYFCCAVIYSLQFVTDFIGNRYNKDGLLLSGLITTQII